MWLQQLDRHDISAESGGLATFLQTGTVAVKWMQLPVARVRRDCLYCPAKTKNNVFQNPDTTAGTFLRI